MREVGRQLGRLFEMSAAEIAFRSRERWCGWRERLAVASGRAARNGFLRAWADGQAAGFWQQFHSRPFYFSRPERDCAAFARHFEELFPGRTVAIVEETEQITAGAPRLFGKRVAFAGGEVDWHRDWETGERLPAAFYRAISTLDPDRRVDLKRVWETNRQQFLVTLGQAYFLTRRPKYAEAAVRLLESWIESNPPYRGVNWKEGLEAGLRLLAWLWTWRLLGGAEALTEATRGRLLTWLDVQREYIERHLSLYSAPNTHLLGEALALLAVGLMFPELGEARQGAAPALKILEEQLERQVATDGSQREQAAYYHCYALEMYLLATVLGLQHRLSFSSAWMKRVERMAEFLLAVVRPDGLLARFGDDDGGRTVRLAAEDYYDPRGLLGVAAVLLERGDFKRAAGALPEEVFWAFGPEGASVYAGLTERDPGTGALWFPDARLGVLRTGWGPQELWLACQGQPMGMMNAGHSHAGLLSFELVLAGKPIIVDPGTGTYQDRPWCDHFRQMEAHNGVQLDAQRWYEPAGPFRWEADERVQPVAAATGPGLALSLGYRTRDTQGRPFEHRRTFVAKSAAEVLLTDRFEGTGRHRLTRWLHFAPGARLRWTARDAFEVEVGETSVLLSLQGFGDFRWKVEEGSETPPAGWVSPRYDQRVPAPVLEIEEEVELPAERTLGFKVVGRGEPELLGAASTRKARGRRED